MTIQPVQETVLKLIELSSFNSFDGEAVAKWLRGNTDKWIGCIWGRFYYYPLITLRDIEHQGDCYNADTLYIKVKPEHVEAVKQAMAELEADEINDATEKELNDLGGVYGETYKVLRIWWD